MNKPTAPRPQRATTEDGSGTMRTSKALICAEELLAVPNDVKVNDSLPGLVRVKVPMTHCPAPPAD